MNDLRSPIRGLTAVGLCALLALAAGCGKARVPKPYEQIRTVKAVSELPYDAKMKPGKQAPPWYREMVVELDTVPKKKVEREQAVEASKGPAFRAAHELLDEVLVAVTARKPKDAPWSLLTLEVMPASSREKQVVVRAELGRTSVYARRHEIAVENVRLEKAMTRLAVKGGMRHAQPPTFNPTINYRRQDVSVMEAIDELLAQHQFKRKYSDVSEVMTLFSKEYPTREKFIETAVDTILHLGTQLRDAVPSVYVYRNPDASELAHQEEKPDSMVLPGVLPAPPEGTPGGIGSAEDDE